jgi:hypothetical protein
MSGVNKVGPTTGKDRPFFGVELKLARARFHAQTLIDSVAEWHRNPLTAHGEISEDRHTYRLILDDFVVAPPIEYWAMLVGDCIHNLRSALDNLSYSAARLQYDPPADPFGIQFPIFDNEVAYREKGERTLRQLPDEAGRLLEHFQPFQQGEPEAIKRHALLALQHLSNQDKHRIPQVVLLRVTQHDHQQKLEFESEAEAAAWISEPPQIVIEGGPVWAGSVLMTVTSARPAGKIKGTLALEAVPAIETAIGPEPATPTLTVLGTQVFTVFEAFRLTFPNARD